MCGSAMCPYQAGQSPESSFLKKFKGCDSYCSMTRKSFRNKSFRNHSISYIEHELYFLKSSSSGSIVP